MHQSGGLTIHIAGNLTHFISLKRHNLYKDKYGKKETKEEKEGEMMNHFSFNPAPPKHSHLTCFVAAFSYSLIIGFCGTANGAQALCIPDNYSCRALSSSLLPVFLTPNVM